VSSMPAYTSGYLLFTREATLLAQAFDSQRLQLAGSVFPVAEDVSRSWADFAAFSVSDNGILAYRGGGAVSTDVQLTWYDRSGKPLETIGGQAAYQGVDLSPDGRRIAAHRHDGSGGDIWLLDGERGTNSRFTFEASQDNSSPVWSPDGSQIAFSSIRGESWVLHRKPSNGAGNEEVLFQSSNPKVPMAWSPDGKNLLYWQLDSKTGADIWVLPLSGDRKPYAFAQSKFSESHPQFSPDGKWVAYSSDQSGKWEIYVQPFPPIGPKWQISTNGGFFPRWRGDGLELYYTEQTQGGKIMAVGVSSEGVTFKAGSPKPLFESPYVNFPHAGWYHTFAVSADGQRFLIPRTVSKDQNKLASQPINVVVNWTAILKK
jgi:dipeptidyl aminopeptidase/acylaminoacyl peptidase